MLHVTASPTIRALRKANRIPPPGTGACKHSAFSTKRVIPEKNVATGKYLKLMGRCKLGLNASNPAQANPSLQIFTAPLLSMPNIHSFS